MISRFCQAKLAVMFCGSKTVGNLKISALARHKKGLHLPNLRFRGKSC